MDDREFLTEEELLSLLRISAGPGLPQARRHVLETAPPQAILPQQWRLEELDLWVTLDAIGDRLKVILSAGAEWRGALVHCRWDWDESTTPQQRDERSVTAFALMPSNADPWNRYTVEFLMPDLVPGCPVVGRIVPRYADPDRFVEAWRSATVKPPTEHLQAWIRANEGKFPPRHRNRWLQLPEELRENSPGGP